MDNGLPGVIPYLVMCCIWGLVLKSISQRKGKSKWLWFFAGFIPGYNFFGGLWLASLPEKSILEEVKVLKNKLQKFDFISKGVQTSSASTKSKTWKCNCGMTNDIGVANCPECGLKRDYLLKQELYPKIVDE
jgi:hypothetical protein